MKNKYKRHFLDTWKSVKDIFIKPNLRFYFGPWKKEGNLPVWRHGPQIWFGKHGEINTKWDYARLVSSEWNELGKKNHPILSKIIKKPVWQLPIWLAFHWYNDDIIYKTKWEEDDFRYEYPAHFTIVFFGLAFSITAYIKPEDKEDWLVQDQYWESILTYKYYNGDLEKTNSVCGWYNRPGENGFRFKFEPRFLKNIVDQDDLIALQDEMYSEIKKKYEEEKKEYEENKIYTISCQISHKELRNDNEVTLFDGWYAVTVNKKFLAYENEKDCERALDNIKKEIEVKIKGTPSKISFHKYIGDRRYYFNWKTKELYKSVVINKNIDMLENVYSSK